MGTKLKIVVTLVALSLALIFFDSPQIHDSLRNIRGDSPSCVARDTIIARGQKWVDINVPYSQTKTYEGYRTDCSGFVSMCWQLPKDGPSTTQFHAYSHNITKSELQAGDAMICEGHHVVLFAGWKGTQKTEYIDMEQYDVGVGTVKKIVPYPYFNLQSCFHPIKSRTVC